MAQNLKAEREALTAAVDAARKKVNEAERLYLKSLTLEKLRVLQVAKDGLARASRQLRELDRADDPEAMRLMDASPRRSRKSWPVGAPERPKVEKPPTEKPDRTPDLPPPPMPRPAVIASRPSERGNVSWWVGVDRATLDEGGTALMRWKAPARTEQPVSKATMKVARQQMADAKNDAKRTKVRATGDVVRRTMRPSARPSAFSEIPSPTE